MLAGAEHQDGVDGGGEHGVRGQLLGAVGGARRVAQRGHREPRLAEVLQQLQRGGARGRGREGRLQRGQQRRGEQRRLGE